MNRQGSSIPVSHSTQPKFNIDNEVMYNGVLYQIQNIDFSAGTYYYKLIGLETYVEEKDLNHKPPVSNHAETMEEVDTKLDGTLTGIQHYFLWLSHGLRIGSDQFYKTECPPSISKINFFIEPGFNIYPTFYDSRWSSQHSQLILDIDWVMKTFRQPTRVECRLDLESQKQTTMLPAISFYGRERGDPEYIYEPMGLYHYEMQANGSFSGRKIMSIPENIGALFYSDIFAYIRKYLESNHLEGSMGLGIFCCRSQHPQYRMSTIRHLRGDYKEPEKYIPLEQSDNKYWFLMTIDNIGKTYRHIFDIGDPTQWSAFLQTKRKGCAINVLSVLGFMNPDQGREIVSCLPVTGTTMYKICDYISQSYPGLKFGVYNLLLNQENIAITFDALVTITPEIKYYTIVKLYDKLEHKGEPSEVGHTVILGIVRGNLFFYDPQNSTTFNLQELLKHGYVSIDIIMCNNNAGDVLRHNILRDLPFKVRNQKYISGGSSSLLRLRENNISNTNINNAVPNFDELYKYLDENPIESINANGIKYTRSYKKNKLTKKQFKSQYTRTKRQKLHTKNIKNKKSRKTNKKR